MADRLMWWAYRHANGSVIVKRWFGDHKDYTDDVQGNDFVLQVKRPFEAGNADQARLLANRELGGDDGR